MILLKRHGRDRMKNLKMEFMDQRREFVRGLQSMEEADALEDGLRAVDAVSSLADWIGM